VGLLPDLRVSVRCGVVEPVFTGGFTMVKFVGEDPEKMWHKAWRQCPVEATTQHEDTVVLFGKLNILVFHVCEKHVPSQKKFVATFTGSSEAASTGGA
jgi:hypothetical protein